MSISVSLMFNVNFNLNGLESVTLEYYFETSVEAR